MPKIIEGARRDILIAAKRQLMEHGYAALTIRGVAAECGIAAGTVYNYFESKDMLVANIILEDWLCACAGMEARCAAASSPIEGIRAVYEALADFQSPYLQVWQEYSFNAKAKRQYGERHAMLVGQLSGILHRLLERFGAAEGEYLDVFLAESILTAVLEQHPFEPFAAILRRVIS